MGVLASTRECSLRNAEWELVRLCEWGLPATFLP